MFIQTEGTPNPSTMKFIPGIEVMGDSGKTIYFKDHAESKNSPLAMSLFDIEGVSGVFFGSDFLTITIENKEWKNIKPSILGVIMNHFVLEKPILINDESETEISNDLDDISEKIKDIIWHDRNIYTLLLLLTLGMVLWVELSVYTLFTFFSPKLTVVWSLKSLPPSYIFVLDILMGVLWR